MPPIAASLASLVQGLVPDSRTNRRLREELVVHCQDILNSHIGSNREQDFSHISDLVRRHLHQSSQSNASALRFTNLLSRLLEQPVLSRKHAVVLFLHTLASSALPAAVSSTFLQSLAPPPVVRPASTRPPSTLSPNIDDDTSRKVAGRPKAELLRRYRAKLGRPHLAEEALLRDALYLLQGISGKYVKLERADVTSKEAKLTFTEDAHHVISAPYRTLIHQLAELGHLYMRVESFVRRREGKADIGMIEQSLSHYFEMQLTEYYRLIAVLESQMHLSASSSLLDGADPEADGFDDAFVGKTQSGLTLRRLDVFVDDWRLRLRMMSSCVESCTGVTGGALVNLIHRYTETGDPFIREFTNQLLEEVSKPFFATLHKWLFSGELDDPFSEFFVVVDPELAHLQYIQPSAMVSDEGFGGTGLVDTDTNESGLRLWESKYTFRKEMLPEFVGEAFGKKIFSTGKSLNFIRYSCHDIDWVATREKLSGSGGVLQYSDIAGLERSIDAAYSIASQRLLDIFFQKFKLMDHLKALKQYLMLGHGDFADQLMDMLGPSLSRPANALYRHNLTATLEAAIRTSNAQHDPSDVLRRLDARMLEYSHGEIGWDVFTLEYKVDAPIDTVLDSESMIGYLKVFSHLWKMKRVEGSLTSAWMRIAGGSRTILRVPELEIEWHQIRLVMAEMIHFIRQMQAFCHLEVIECSWKALVDFINKKEGDLDALINAHRKYIDEIVKKILLRNLKPGKEDVLLNQVLELFHLILQFREAIDDFYNFSLAEAARQDAKKDHDRGVYTDHRPSSLSGRLTSDALPRILQNVRAYGSSFSEKIQSTVHALQVHPDQDCRNLAIRLSFSDYYKVRREHKS